MRVQSKVIKTSVLFITLVVLTFVVLPVYAGASKSFKSQKSNLKAQSAEIKTEAMVAMDISLNALSNVIATFRDAEKDITSKLHTGNASDIKEMVRNLGESWKSEEDVLKKIEKISSYVTSATTSLNKVEIQLDALSTNQNSKTYIKKANKVTARARKNVNKASAIAEELKQVWLIPIEKEAPEKQ
jgi:ABC-type glycerol-3-phosphate transport system permease component